MLAALAGIGLGRLLVRRGPRPEPTETVATVTINPDDYVGREVDEVAEELEELGFTVDRGARRRGTRRHRFGPQPHREVEEAEIRVSCSMAPVANRNWPLSLRGKVPPAPNTTMEQRRPE